MKDWTVLRELLIYVQSRQTLDPLKSLKISLLKERIALPLIIQYGFYVVTHVKCMAFLCSHLNIAVMFTGTASVRSKHASWAQKQIIRLH